MFTKPDKLGQGAHSFDAGARGEPTRRSSPSVPSMISGDVSIKGDITGEGELHVDGAITGDVTVNRLVIGESGLVEGAIIAEAVDVRGRVVGSISAPHVRLHATAKLDGDIAHEQLTMEAGAHFLGRSLRYKAATAVPVSTGEVIDISAAG